MQSGSPNGVGPSRIEGGLRCKGVRKKTEPDKPLITLITVVYNGAYHFGECIDSVTSQTYENIEYIVIDGGSTDGTVDLLRAYSDRIDYWLSEPDDGIYDAMNKGVRHSFGEIIGILGSDDVFISDAIDRVAEKFCANPEISFTYGPVEIVDGSGNLIGRTEPMHPTEIRNNPLRDMPFNHLSLFVRSQLYRDVGGFDLNFPVRADYDFVLRLIKHGALSDPLDGIVGKFRSGGKSSGISTCFETRRLMYAHGASPARAELRFLKSLTIAILPFSILRLLVRAFARSRHTLE